MENKGTLILELVDAEGDAAADVDCAIDVLRLDGMSILRSQGLEFPPQHAFSLPAFPQAQNLRCIIAPSRYQLVQSEFFTLNDGERRQDSALLLRNPERWRPVFTTWNNLPSPFDPLKAVVANVLLKLKHGADIGLLTPVVYDAISTPPAMLAKMALLNLFAVLRTEIDPVSEQPWFNFVERIVTIDRERFVATVNSNLYESVDHIRNNIGNFKRLGFFPGDTALHHDNIPSNFALTSPMFSVKCAYAQGNTQFSVAKARNQEGADCVLLDCDMDEHSNILKHGSDLFKHIFSRGTHPIDIHEYIVHHRSHIDLGYDLRGI